MVSSLYDVLLITLNGYVTPLYIVSSMFLVGVFMSNLSTTSYPLIPDLDMNVLTTYSILFFSPNGDNLKDLFVVRVYSCSLHPPKNSIMELL